MDTLHAPWRIDYILSPKPELKAGLFTRIAQSSDDVANYVIARDRSCFALLNAYPYVGGHLMTVPYKETADLHGLTDEELTDLMKLVRRSQDALTSVMKPNGFNIGLNLGHAAGENQIAVGKNYFIARRTGREPARGVGDFEIF